MQITFSTIWNEKEPLLHTVMPTRHACPLLHTRAAVGPFQSSFLLTYTVARVMFQRPNRKVRMLIRASHTCTWTVKERNKWQDVLTWKRFSLGSYVHLIIHIYRKGKYATLLYTWRGLNLFWKDIWKNWLPTVLWISLLLYKL